MGMLEDDVTEATRMSLRDQKIEVLTRALSAMVDRWEPDTEGQDRVMWESAKEALAFDAISDHWQPIETAPKDKVLLLFGVSDLWENGAVQNWKMETGFWQDGAECWRWEGRQVRKYDTQPTHWRPLPDPPMLYRSVKCQTP